MIGSAAMLFTSLRFALALYVARGVRMATPVWQWSAVDTASAIRDGRVDARGGS